MEKEARIGKRYRVKYDDFLPSLYPLYKKRREERSNYYYEYYDDNLGLYYPEWDEYYLNMFETNSTIVEYIGNGLCKDLTTGMIIRENNTTNILESIEIPICLDNGLYNYNLVEDEEYPEYTKETIRIITDYLHRYEDNILNQMKDYVSYNERKMIDNKKQKIDEEKINRVFCVPYSSLSAVLKNQDIFLDPRSKELYTIVRYLGKGLYKDLITNNIYQDHHINGIFFEHQSQKSNADEFYRAMVYPISIDQKDIKPVKDSQIEEILRNREEISSLVSNSIKYNIKNLRALYQIELARKVSEEYKNQTYIEKEDSKDGLSLRLSNKQK